MQLEIDNKPNPSPSSPPPTQGQLLSDASPWLFWCGMALVGFALVSIGIGLMPLAIMKPDWQQNAVQLLQSQGLNALLGSTLIAASPLLNPLDHRRTKIVERVRLIAALTVIGWLLLMPLAVSSTIELRAASFRQENRNLLQLERLIKAIASTTQESEFRLLFEQLAPQNPPFPTPLPAPLTLLRDQVTAQSNALLQQQKTELKDSQRQRSVALFLQTITKLLLSLVLATGFAAVGRWSSTSPTVLDELKQSVFDFRALTNKLAEEIKTFVLGLRNAIIKPQKPSALLRRPKRPNPIAALFNNLNSKNPNRRRKPTTYFPKQPNPILAAFKKQIENLRRRPRPKGRKRLPRR